MGDVIHATFEPQAFALSGSYRIVAVPDGDGGFRFRVIGFAFEGETATAEILGLFPRWALALVFVVGLEPFMGPRPLLDTAVLHHGDLSQMKPPAAYVNIRYEADGYEVYVSPAGSTLRWIAQHSVGLSLDEARAIGKQLAEQCWIELFEHPTPGDAA